MIRPMPDTPTPPDTRPNGATATSTRIGRPGRGLAHELVAAYGERLRSGAIKPGERLPTEAEMMESFGVSRGVVREALSRLGAAGLIQTLHGIGSFALEAREDAGRFRIEAPSQDGLTDMLDVLELRASLESDAAGLAATRRSDAQLQEMRAALDDFARHLDTVGNTVEPDFRFHLAIANATGNRYYGELMRQLGLAVIPRTRVSSARLDADHRAEHLHKVNQEHLDIYAAIERRDPEAARAAMRIHLVNSRERQRRAHAGEPVPGAAAVRRPSAV